SGAGAEGAASDGHVTRSHAATASKHRGDRKAGAKNDAKNGKLFHAENSSYSYVANSEVGLTLVFRSNNSLSGETAARALEGGSPVSVAAGILHLLKPGTQRAPRDGP